MLIERKRVCEGVFGVPPLTHEWLSWTYSSIKNKSEIETEREKKIQISFSPKITVH